jgi:hypothetical protein
LANGATGLEVRQAELDVVEDVVLLLRRLRLDVQERRADLLGALLAASAIASSAVRKNLMRGPESSTSSLSSLPVRCAWMSFDSRHASAVPGRSDLSTFPPASLDPQPEASASSANGSAKRGRFTGGAG